MTLRTENRSTYASWAKMRRRCIDPTYHGFADYGGRGITFCERWESFEKFFDDMGARPAGKTLDRREVNKNYEPGNCRWADAFEQANNTRVNHFIEFNGQRKTVAQWARELGMLEATLSWRLVTENWPVETAFQTPVRRYRHAR